MKNLLTGSVAVSLILGLGLGCSALRGLVPKKGKYFEGNAAQTAAAAVKDKIGKPFKVVEVFIDDNEFRVHAQDPNNPRHVDEYKYVAGFVSGPAPIQLNGLIEDPEKGSFPFDEIDFSAVPKFTKEALERAGIEGGKIYRMTFQRAFAITDNNAGALGSARWDIEINGARENVTAAADPKGNLLGVDLSHTSKAADYHLLSRAELQKAQDALRDLLASRPDVVEIVIYDKSLMCKVPNQQNPRVEDGFQFGINGLTKQGLVQTPSIKLPDRENFEISGVELPNAADLFEKAKSRLGMPNASLASLSIRRSKSVFDKKGFRTLWDVSLKSGPNEGYVVYDNDGNELRGRTNGETVFDEK